MTLSICKSSIRFFIFLQDFSGTPPLRDNLYPIFTAISFK